MGMARGSNKKFLRFKGTRPIDFHGVLLSGPEVKSIMRRSLSSLIAARLNFLAFQAFRGPMVGSAASQKITELRLQNENAEKEAAMLIGKNRLSKIMGSQPYKNLVEGEFMKEALAEIPHLDFGKDLPEWKREQIREIISTAVRMKFEPSRILSLRAAAKKAGVEYSPK